MRRVKRCAYLTMHDPGDFVTDYELSFDAMAALGWCVDTVPWRDTSIDWNEFDAVYICTPWDYPQDAELFMHVLETIDASSAHLLNSLSLVKWTLTKTYLRDLEARGAAIVPSIWFDDIDLARHLQKTFDGRPFFVQPFMQNVQSEGEYSLFFFGGEYSHAILKTPEPGDFRCQEEHGADIKAITATNIQVETAQRLLALIDPQPVYVRADFVRDAGDSFLLMELELIEPSLYLRTDARAADRFARAFDKRFQILTGK